MTSKTHKHKKHQQRKRQSLKVAKTLRHEKNRQRRKRQAIGTASATVPKSNTSSTKKTTMVDQTKKDEASKDSGSGDNTTNDKNDDNKPPLIFQNVMKEYQNQDASLAFFELANASRICYQWPHDNTKRSITIRQNSQAQTHTGGVVWETSYLLLEYLQFVHHPSNKKTQTIGPRLVEVGAGCGLLGLALAEANLSGLGQVLLTETQEVLDTILQPNVQANTATQNAKGATTVSACALDWLQYHSDFKRYMATKSNEESKNNNSSLAPEQHQFDTIVGTDVVFSPSLVEPLLATLQFLSHDTTVTYLCLQSDRCPTSYQLLQSKAASYGFQVQEIDLRELATQEPQQGSSIAAPSFVKWGLALECHLLCLQRIPMSEKKISTN